MAQVRWIALVLGSAMTLAGCIASDRPALSTNSAQNVGSVLQYRIFQSSSEAGFARLEAARGAGYNLSIVDGSGFGEMVATGVLVRKVGTRKRTPVYLVQIDGRKLADSDFATSDNPRYFVYLVNVTADGRGYVASIDCRDEALGSAVGAAGGKVSCVDIGAPAGPLPQLFGGLDEAALRKVLMGLMASGALVWEDQTGRSVLGVIE